MKLRNKVFVGVLGSLLVVLAALFHMISSRLEKGFLELENESIRTNVGRVEDAIHNQINNYLSKQSDWASWDDAYAFIENRNEAFISSNLTDKTMAESLKLDVIFFVNTKGKIVYKKSVDLKTGKEIEIPDELVKMAEPGSPLLQLHDLTSRLRGFIVTQTGVPYIFVSQPILTSNREGPIRGWMIWGFKFDEEILKNLSEITHLQFDLILLNTPDLYERFAKSFHESKGVMIERHSEKMASGYTLVKDIRGKPVFVLKVHQQRNIHQIGQEALDYVLIFLSISLILAGIILMVFLDRLIILRLSKMESSLGEITRSEKHALRLPHMGNDEIGRLALAANRMLDSLEKNHHELTENEVRYRELSENIPVGIFEADQKGMFTYVNHQWTNLTGLSIYESLGNGWMMALHHEDANKVFQQWEGCLNLGQSFEMEFRFQPKTEKTVWVYGVAIRSKQRSDGTYQYLGSVLDITPLRKAQEAIHEVQLQLQESQKMEAIGKLAGGIAHDFNNILSGILGYASILKEKFAKEEKVSRQLDVIVRSAERGAQLVKQLLGFARRGQYEKKVINLNESITETLQLLGSTMGQKIALKQDLEPHLWKIEGDSSQILQVFMNLGVNSRDAMPNGGEIFIQSENLELKTEEECQKRNLQRLKPGRYVHVIFKDTGTGVPEEIRHKIYDPFFTTKAPGKGTGLGLSMTYGIIQNHKGIIDLENTPQLGATFHLYFPALTDESLMGLEMSATAGAETPSPLMDEMSFWKDRQILLADDESMILDFLKEILESKGVSVYCASNGKEAVQIVQEKRGNLDAAILDVIMPVMNGLKAYEEIQKVDSALPVIFGSGYSEGESIAQLQRAGKVSFVQKPFKKEELLKLLAEKMRKGKTLSENKA